MTSAGLFLIFPTLLLNHCQFCGVLRTLPNETNTHIVPTSESDLASRNMSAEIGRLHQWTQGRFWNFNSCLRALTRDSHCYQFLMPAVIDIAHALSLLFALVLCLCPGFPAFFTYAPPTHPILSTNDGNLYVYQMWRVWQVPWLARG